MQAIFGVPTLRGERRADLVRLRRTRSALLSPLRVGTLAAHSTNRPEPIHMGGGSAIMKELSPPNMVQRRTDSRWLLLPVSATRATTSRSARTAHGVKSRWTAP